MTPGDILAAYVAVGEHYAALTTPYAIRLWYLLMVIEICTTGLTYMMDADGAGALFGKGIRLILMGGFSYWWITNSWTLAKIILGSFNQLGQDITGLPQLTPIGFVTIGTQIAQTLWQAPSSAHYLPDIPLAIGEIALAILILICMLLLAGAVIFTLATAWLIIGPATILVPLMVNRFTTGMAEGYFSWLLRTGVLLLFFYVVLGTAMGFASEWNTALQTGCGAVAGTCTKPIPTGDLLTLLGSAFILSIICIGVPFTAAHLVTNGVNMTLEHIAAAKYIAGSGIRAANNAYSHSSHSGSQSSISRNTLEQRLYAGSQAAQSTPAMNPSTAPTQRSIRP